MYSLILYACVAILSIRWLVYPSLPLRPHVTLIFDLSASLPSSLPLFLSFFLQGVGVSLCFSLSLCLSVWWFQCPTSWVPRRAMAAASSAVAPHVSAWVGRIALEGCRQERGF